MIPYYRLIRGNFIITGKQPDGDSVRFAPDNLDELRPLHNAFRIKPNKNDGSVQLRFEAVDAPEVHYGAAAQPRGDDARDELLEWMGFKNVQFSGSAGLTVDSATPDKVRGAILTQGADVNGRPISYALLDADAEGIGDDNFVRATSDLLRRTLNHRLLETGEAYLTVYNTTPREHRDFFREVAMEARNANLGVWAKDDTPEFRLRDQEDIGPEGALILPKLFRRCTDYLKAVDGGFAGTLPDWLSAHSSGTRLENDPILIGERIGPVAMGSLIQQRNSHISFEADILDITVIAK